MELEKFLKSSRNIHCWGIAGIGLSAVAVLLKDMGHSITGSDYKARPPASDYLNEVGIPYNVPFSSSTFPENIDLIVSRRFGKGLGANSKLEEERKAKEQNVPIVYFPQVLEALTKRKHNIVCAGSYGKSSIAALVAHILEVSKKSPSFFIGAKAYNFSRTARFTSSKFFVLEGDEYPGDIDSNRAKFMYYNTTDILITSAVHDHFNIFETQEEFSNQFEELLTSLDATALKVINIDEKNSKKLQEKYGGVSYAINNGNADWTVTNIKYSDITKFDLIHKEKNLGTIETNLLGIFNIENILGVAALLLERNYVTFEEFQTGVKTFKGVARRLDLKTKDSSIKVYESFGSSYEKARGDIDAIIPYKKDQLAVLLEPHSLSWKKEAYLERYKTIFNGVDKGLLFLGKEVKSHTTPQIVQKIKDYTPPNITIIEDSVELLEILKSEIKEGDVLLTLSSGDFEGVLKEFIDITEKRK